MPSRGAKRAALRGVHSGLASVTEGSAVTEYRLQNKKYSTPGLRRYGGDAACSPPLSTRARGGVLINLLSILYYI